VRGIDGPNQVEELDGASEVLEPFRSGLFGKKESLMRRGLLWRRSSTGHDTGGVLQVDGRSSVGDGAPDMRCWRGKTCGGCDGGQRR
jgi:hypothetical protein